MDRWKTTSVMGHAHWFDEGKKRSLCGGHQAIHARTPSGKPRECPQCDRLLQERASREAAQ